MILANGTWNGKKYAQENITVDEILEGVDKAHKIREYLTRDNVFIERPSDKVEFDPLNNEYRRSASISMTPVYTVSDTKRRDRCSFRYYEAEATLADNKKQYEPYIIEVMDCSVSRALSWENKELMTFLLLSPKCVDSPFAAAENHSYKIKDMAIVAKEANAVNKRLTMLHAAIYKEAEENPDFLTRKAQGISIHREKIAVDFSEIEEVVRGLIDMSRKYPNDFELAFTHHETAVRGLITDCIRQGVISYTVEGGETVAMLNGAEICRFPKIVEAVLGIQEYVTSNNFDFYNKEMTNALLEINLKNKRKKK